MKRVYIKHIEKCSDCPAHKLVKRRVSCPVITCDEYHMLIQEKDYGGFPAFCDLKKI
jgi:hypothetical protein